MPYIKPEEKVQKQIVDYLTSLEKEGHPLFHEVRTGSAGFNYKKGRSDLYFVYNGQHVEVEVKALSNTRSTMQDKWKWKCESIYHILYCCPYTFSEFKKWFDEHFPSM